MVAAGRARGRDLVLGDLNDFVPAEPVQATTIFRAIYYARDRRAFFERVASYTERKLVFDLNPRQYALEDVRSRSARPPASTCSTRGRSSCRRRGRCPFLKALERRRRSRASLLRYRFTLLCSASRRAAAS